MKKLALCLMVARLLFSCGEELEKDSAAGDGESDEDELKNDQLTGSMADFVFRNLDNTWTGSGDRVLTGISLNKGLAVFQLSHEGERNFIVSLKRVGDRIGLLANEIGDVDQVRTVAKIPEDGDSYFLEVSADGEWDVSLVAPKIFDSPPSLIKGEGQSVSGVFWIDENETIKLSGSHSGSRNFIVTVHGALSGERQRGVFNEIGKYEGEATFSPRESGPVIFDVKADGEWTIRLESL